MHSCNPALKGKVWVAPRQKNHPMFKASLSCFVSSNQPTLYTETLSQETKIKQTTYNKNKQVSVVIRQELEPAEALGPPGATSKMEPSRKVYKLSF